MLQAELKILIGKHQGKVIPVTVKKFLIGREQDCHLRPNSELVSRHHCVLSVDDFSVRIRDLGSTNGTRVNGEAIRGEVVLKHGDTLSVGKLEMQLVVGRAARVAATVVAEPEHQMSEPAAPHADRTVNVDRTLSEMPIAAVLGESSGSVLDTSYEIPAMTGDASQTMAHGDTAIHAGGQVVDPAAMQGQQYPPGYGQPAMGYPMGAYPAMPQGYPYGMYPQGMPVGYGAPQMGMTPPPGMMYSAYPAAPIGYGAPMGYAQVAAPAVEESSGGKAVPANTVAVPPLRLPKPEETGIRQDAAPAPAPVAAVPGAAPAAKPSTSAADIIKQYLNRRGGEK